MPNFKPSDVKVGDFLYRVELIDLSDRPQFAQLWKYEVTRWGKRLGELKKVSRSQSRIYEAIVEFTFRYSLTPQDAVDFAIRCAADDIRRAQNVIEERNWEIYFYRQVRW